MNDVTSSERARSEALERTMLSLRDAREPHDVLAIVARGLTFDFKRPCVAYESRDGTFRAISASNGPRENRVLEYDEIDGGALRTGAVIRREGRDLIGVSSDGVLRAVLSIENATEPLEAEGVRYLRSLAVHTAVSLENALAFEQLRRYAAEGAALTEVARTLLGFRELEPLALALARVGLRLFSAERACIYVPRHGVRQLIAFASTRVDVDAPDSLPEGEEAIAIDLLERAFAPAHAMIAGVALHADAVDDGSRGLLAFSRPARFERPERRLLETFVTLAALAIRNVDLYEQSQAANRALAESNAFKDDLMAMFAHDFKGPLTVISGFSELLFESADADARKSAETIVEQTQRLAKLSDDALALAMTQSAGFSLQRRHEDVGEWLEGLIGQLDPNRERIEFRVDGPSIGATFDRARLRHVVDNMIGNALKYSSGRVLVALEKRSDTVRISVVDRGIGIPEPEVGRIFAKFGRATNARSRGIGGSGVGLYIAKKIVDVHGGRIDVESVENEGSTFTLVLPAGE